ncbi:MAG: hypothetical protein ACO1RX_07470 [Candidatus Sericytochromatia bacterium]
MSDAQSLSRLRGPALAPAPSPVSSPVGQTPPSSLAAAAPPAQTGLRAGLRGGAVLNLPNAAELNALTEQAQPHHMRENARSVPIPSFLQPMLQPGEPPAPETSAACVARLMQGQSPSGPRWSGVLRDAAAIEKSGILPELRALAALNPSVPESELNRSVQDDATLVLTGFAQMTPTQIAALKEKAYQHPDVAPEQAAAVASGHYGSERHKTYGALVESLTGGLLSAEEAMAMNPTGGLPGDGASEIPLIGHIDAVARHAQRHDATGFLLTRFGVGPGYGSPTTPLGLNNANPLAGQWLGILREGLGEASSLPDGSHVALPERFRVQT